jgi:hypothetical protein
VNSARAYDGIGCQFFGRLTHRLIVGKYKPGFDRRLSLGAAFKQAALDEKTVGTLARRTHSMLPSALREPG